MRNIGFNYIIYCKLMNLLINKPNINKLLKHEKTKHETNFVEK